MNFLYELLMSLRRENRIQKRPAGGPRAGGIAAFMVTVEHVIQSTYFWVTNQDKFLSFKSKWKEKLLLKT